MQMVKKTGKIIIKTQGERKEIPKPKVYLKIIESSKYFYTKYYMKKDMYLAITGVSCSNNLW